MYFVNKCDTFYILNAASKVQQEKTYGHKEDFCVEHEEQKTDYELFYKDIQALEKSIKDKLQQMQRSFRNITKDSATGDIKKLEKNTSEMQMLITELSNLSNEISQTISSFDSIGYFESGDFTRQMVEYCKQFGVDVKGESPTYEIFPFKVRIDAENQDLYVNRKKVSCQRPLHFTREIKNNVEKYTKSGFNLERFIQELAAAYDLSETVRNSKSPSPRLETDMALKDLYAYMAPTQKARRDYDLQNFAYDLSRLYASYSSGLKEAKDGRKFEFGSTRQTGKLIRIIDSNGVERFLGTIRFYVEQ